MEYIDFIKFNSFVTFILSQLNLLRILSILSIIASIIVTNFSNQVNRHLMNGNWQNIKNVFCPWKWRKESLKNTTCLCIRWLKRNFLFQLCASFMSFSLNFNNGKQCLWVLWCFIISPNSKPFYHNLFTYIIWDIFLN